MSIMDGQLDDLDGNPVLDDPSLIQPPNPLPAIKQQATLEPVNDTNQGEAVKLKKDYEAKLPLMDIQFKLVEGQTAKLADMEDVVNQITTNGSVDQQAADDVNVVFENFYSETMTRNHFTATPSKINLDRVLDFAKKRVAVESHLVVESILHLSKDPADSIQAMLNDISDHYLESLEHGFDTLKKIASEFSTDVTEQSNFFKQSGNKMLDLRNMDLIEQTEDPTAVSREERFKVITESFSNLFKDKAFGSYVRIVAEGSDGKQMTEMARSVEYGEGPICLIDIHNFWKNFDHTAYLEAFRFSLTECLEDVKKIKAHSAMCSDQGSDAASRFYAENINTMTSLNDAQKRIYNFTYSFLVFNMVSEQLFLIFTQ